MSEPTIREHLDHALVDLKFGYVGEARGRIWAALDLLNNAEACELPGLPVAAARAGHAIPAMRHRILRDPEAAS